MQAGREEGGTNGTHRTTHQKRGNSCSNLISSSSQWLFFRSGSRTWITATSVGQLDKPHPEAFHTDLPQTTLTYLVWKKNSTSMAMSLSNYRQYLRWLP